ncbi:polysaccharide biosynthesis C-terminal domain-containing protein [Cytophaga hutchinsonii]|uniref:Possible O-antigen transporter n=1 Tax=Cytophaga hutchinsonii (strain ATCC 33406 / DSM 1761 / CIP 103989 / NBRC 15051 / NCIMB 9469 / D465) TaxID=269798 RepID=A0A6N4SU83_CYTH3|nr:polysaccharide biosynthesis C-terminal domain-containing protein [Cytophaga hutchinsonii]ABG60026.1 possible O-antigen transporter [Cytophaga hutchinsonii ATCC 33406]SFX25475.1 Membrane protein involved in the export of O-antigen and teichoic acid [Cytophaga hutchinsonii ATCC 33406]
MHKKTLISTFVVRFILALNTFGIFILSSRYLGADGRGTISLFIANVTIVQLFSEVIFGSGYIYFIHQYSKKDIITYGFILSTLAGILVPLILYVTGLHPAGLVTDLIINSILFAWVNWIGLHLRAHKKFAFYNAFYLFLSVFQLTLIWLMLEQKATIQQYINGLQIHLAICFAVGLLFLWAVSKHTVQSTHAPVHWFELIKKSIISQYSNWLFFLNTRISYYLIYVYIKDNTLLGIYSAASILTEAVWIIPLALATPLYPIISSDPDKEKTVQLTNEYAYASFWLSLAATVLLLLVPEAVMEFVIGKDFTGLHSFILVLAAGTVILSYAKIYWNYFQGMGLFKINAKATLISFVVPLLLFVPFIPMLGVYGIAFMSCCSYLVYSFVLMYYYHKETHTSWKALLLPGFRLFPNV